MQHLGDVSKARESGDLREENRDGDKETEVGKEVVEEDKGKVITDLKLTGDKEQEWREKRELVNKNEIVSRIRVRVVEVILKELSDQIVTEVEEKKMLLTRAEEDSMSWT